jgi:VanZ family protein
MGLIFYLSAQPDLPQIKTGWIDLVAGYGAHFSLYGVLGALSMRALAGRQHAAAAAFALVALYAVSDEFHQGFVPGRHPSLADLITDLVGAGLGVWIYLRLNSRSPSKP